MDESGDRKVQRLRPQTPEQQAEIHNKRIQSLIAGVKTTTFIELVRISNRAKQLRINHRLKDISELENELLQMPKNWNAPDKEGYDIPYWITLVDMLEEKYRDRDQVQSGRD